MNVLFQGVDADYDLPRFTRMKTGAIRACRERGIRITRESSCGQKTRMSVDFARRVADRILGRAYKCPFCRGWHVTSTAVRGY